MLINRKRFQGNKYFRNKDYEQAVVCYSEALSAGGMKPVYLCNLAAAFLKLGL
jgi:hypothetical protein